MSCLRVAVVAALFFGTSLIEAGEKGGRLPNRTSVRIADCRIVLIDHVVLACDRSGILKSVEFKEGMQVQARQQVALVADEIAVANLSLAERKGANNVEVRFNRKASEIAETEYRKNAEANKKAADAGKGNPVALLEVEKLRLAAEKAVLSIEQAEHELLLNKLTAEVSRAELASYSVLAEFDGVVTRVYRKKGEAVRQGDPIVEVVNTDRVRIEGRIDLANLRFAKQGAMVKVRLSVPDLDLPEEREEFSGQITFVDLISDPVTHETRIFADVRNKDNILRAGLTAEMILEVDDSN
jgi:multidrug efflux pump subunit AcrA (membrane-fusion protein)